MLVPGIRTINEGNLISVPVAVLAADELFVQLRRDLLRGTDKDRIARNCRHQSAV